MTRRLDPPHRSHASQAGACGEPLMDINEVAVWLNTSVRHLRRLVAERRIPYHKIGAKLRFQRRELEEWVAASLVPVHDEQAWRPALRSGRWRAS